MVSQKAYLKKGNIISWLLVVILLFSVTISIIVVYWNINNNKLKKIINQSIYNYNETEEIYNLYLNNDLNLEYDVLENGAIKIYYHEQYFYIYEKNGYLLIERKQNE